MVVTLTEGAVAAWPELPDWSFQDQISVMVNGGSPKDPILQCLGIRSIASDENNKTVFRMKVSDGVHSFVAAALDTSLNSYVNEGRLKENTVFKVTQHQTVCRDSTRVVVFFALDILQTAEEVDGKIGNPMPISCTQTGCVNPTAHQLMALKNVETLSKGFIAAMMNGESPKDPILQCLGIKTFSPNNTTRMRIVISDGVHYFTSAMLATGLNSYVKEGKLKINTVFKLTRYQSSLLEPWEKRVLICLSMSIVQTAQEVGGKIGNPKHAEIGCKVAPANQLRTLNKIVPLTKGFVASMINGESPKDPILQCLGITTLSPNNMKRMRIVISDGVHYFTSAMLATGLNSYVEEGKLEKNTVFKLTQYQSAPMEPERVLICLSISIVQTAQEVGGKIGNPISVHDTQSGLPKPPNKTNKRLIAESTNFSCSKTIAGESDENPTKKAKQ